MTAWVGSLDTTPVGRVWAACTKNGLAAVTIGGTRQAFVESLRARGLSPVVEGGEQVRSALAQIAEYLDGRRQVFDLALDWSAMGAFQRESLQLVCAIPYGQVSTYGEIARRLGRPKAMRAVGRANATNPISLVIPCHRLVGSDGSLRGYGAPGGIATKRWLLDLESSS